MIFGGYLVKDTATTVQIGPVVDDGDGVSYESGLSPTVYVSKANAAFAARNSASAINYDRGGYFRVPIDTTDTNSYGRLIVSIEGAAASNLHCDVEFWVVSQSEYDMRTRGMVAFLTYFMQTTTTSVEADTAFTGYADKTPGKVLLNMGINKVTRDSTNDLLVSKKADGTTTALSTAITEATATTAVTVIGAAS